MRYEFLQHSIWSCGAVGVSLLDLGLYFTDTQRLLTLFGTVIVQDVDLAILQKLFRMDTVAYLRIGRVWKRMEDMFEY